MLISEYLKILTKKVEEIECGTMQEDEMPNTFLLLKHHNLTDLSALNSPSMTLGDIGF